ncbi:hypothetical protein ACNTMW_01355 [Planosporangium sp. 12N6]|uniref:hypothetical protein n=1 Tax=Planosporangium spinosum TaxID=3402278 RepID=UPI003CE7C1B5
MGALVGESLTAAATAAHVLSRLLTPALVVVVLTATWCATGLAGRARRSAYLLAFSAMAVWAPVACWYGQRTLRLHHLLAGEALMISLVAPLLMLISMISLLSRTH